MKERLLIWRSGVFILALALILFLKLEHFSDGLNSTTHICINALPGWKPSLYLPRNASSEGRSDGDKAAAAPPIADGMHPPFGFPPNISLEEAFYVRMKTIDVQKITEKASDILRTRFLANNNFLRYPLLSMENVCMEPDGSLLLVNISEEEIRSNTTWIPELYFVWHDIYASCGNLSRETCTGVRHTDRVPEKNSWIAGNTLHFLPYLGNSMHNWCERIYQNIVAHVHPFNETTPKPIHHFIIHRFDQFMEEAAHDRLDRSILLWQARMLMELSKGSDYLLVKNQAHAICFERLLLQMHDADRMDHTKLPPEIYIPAMAKLRAATFNFFDLPLPEVHTPPQRLRVLVHGRRDARRRTITNTAEIVDYLRNFSRPKLEVFLLEEMVTKGETSYKFPDMVSVFSQTDIVVVAHGTVTGNTIFLPRGAGVVELFGPCNWGNRNNTDLSEMHSWMRVHTDTLMLKHDRSNPFGEAVANPRTGNTTECRDPFNGVPDYTVDTEKLGKIINSFAYPDHPGDPLTLHWLHDWSKDDQP